MPLILYKVLPFLELNKEIWGKEFWKVLLGFMFPLQSRGAFPLYSNGGFKEITLSFKLPLK